MKTLPDHPNLHLVDHPLVQSKLTEMRQPHTQSFGFRSMLREISLLMGYEVTRDLTLSSKKISTPLAEMDAPTLPGPIPAIIPILRAGTVMADALHELIPMSPVGHIGIHRDPSTLKPGEYFTRLPEDVPNRLYLLADPMLATGQTASHAIYVLQRHGVAPGRIRLVSLVAAPEGVRFLMDRHPKVKAYAAALDNGLNAKGYILPGLGDASDSMFGTK